MPGIPETIEVLRYDPSKRDYIPFSIRPREFNPMMISLDLDFNNTRLSPETRGKLVSWGYFFSTHKDEIVYN
jgi:hypothetical protein